MINDKISQAATQVNIFIIFAKTLEQYTIEGIKIHPEVIYCTNILLNTWKAATTLRSWS